MRTLKHLVILSLVALVAVFLAAPSAMAKKALSEDEMDLITAAGQPKIIQTGTGSITFSDTPVYTISLSSSSQTTLTALVLNNVSGENQTATGLNINATTFGTFATQTNSITQSWGATKDWTSSTIAGVAATAAASAAATASGGDSCTAGGSTGTNVKCGISKGGNGAASTSAAAAASTSPGSNKILTKYADDIVETDSGDIFVHQNGLATLALDTGSQTSLAALVVNNVVGLNQTAAGVNITSQGIGFLPLLIGGGGSPVAAGASQSNTIIQYRGTPFSRPAAP